MAPKEPTRHQLSSRLAYSQGTPAFLQKLKNQVAGVSSRNEDEEFDEWQSSSGRPPIPRRPSPPQRPEDDPGSAEEDSDDEKPQIVVLKEGKHMSAIEVENEKRKVKGLPPLPSESVRGEDEPSGSSSWKKDSGGKAEAGARDAKSTSLSFSSTGTGPKNRPANKKRKALEVEGEDELQKAASKGAKPEKKAKKGKAQKTGSLLSFDDGNEG